MIILHKLTLKRSSIEEETQVSLQHPATVVYTVYSGTLGLHGRQVLDEDNFVVEYHAGTTYWHTSLKTCLTP